MGGRALAVDELGLDAPGLALEEVGLGVVDLVGLEHVVVVVHLVLTSRRP